MCSIVIDVLSSCCCCCWFPFLDRDRNAVEIEILFLGVENVEAAELADCCVKSCAVLKVDD